MKSILFSLALFFIISHIAFSQTETAYAYPASIKIDGKLDDWKNIEKYPINQFPYGNRSIKDDKDLSAFFQAAYNKDLQELYFAVTIQDEENILDKSEGAAWNSQDTYNFYFDEKHLKDGSGVVMYSFNEAFQFNSDISKSWDEELRKQKSVDWSKIDKKITTTKGKKIIEFKIKPNRILESGIALGIDQMIVDLDTDENFEMATWTNNGGKSSIAGRLGTLILLENPSDLATLKGKLNWKTDTISVYPEKIRIYDTQKPTLWTNVLVDSIGNFETQLPKGNYKIALEDNIIRIGEKYNRNKVEDNFVTIKEENPILELSIFISEMEDLVPRKGLLLDGLSIQDEHQIDAFVRSYMQHYDIAGASLALVDNGEVVFHNNYGYKSYASKEPINKRTLFEGASTTKPVFAFAVMRLVERGIIDLDKPLHLYHEAPKDVQDDPNHKLITARMVLSHTTGFPNWAYANPDGKLDIKFTPGTKYQYSGAGFEYLKDVVVKVTGKDISTILKEEVLDVLELENM